MMRLVKLLINQGYHLYFDNFYTSVTLVKDLFCLMLPATGTAAENRRGFPNSIKNNKTVGKKRAEGKHEMEKGWSLSSFTVER